MVSKLVALFTVIENPTNHPVEDYKNIVLKFSVICLQFNSWFRRYRDINEFKVFFVLFSYKTSHDIRGADPARWRGAPYSNSDVQM